jgi:hypothetical protein
MWYLRTDAAPQIGYWSDPGLPDSVLGDNFLTFADAHTQGDQIVGGIGDFGGQLVVFEERSVWTVSGTGEITGVTVDWTRRRSDAETGTVHGRTVARVPAGSKYLDQQSVIQTTEISTLAYLTPLGDIRLFDGKSDTIISNPVKDELLQLNYAFRSRAFQVTDPARGEIAWVIPMGTNSEPSTALVWNVRWGVWYVREWGFAHAVQLDSSSESSFLLASGNTVSGVVYRLWSGQSFAGTSFRAQWMSKTLYGLDADGQPDLSRRKRWRWGDFLFQTEQTVTLTLEWLEGHAPDNAAALGSKQFSPATQELATADGDLILTADGDTILVSADSALANAKFRDTNKRYLHERCIRFRVYDSAQDGSWALEAINLAYQILPGLKRRSGALDSD